MSVLFSKNNVCEVIKGFSMEGTAMRGPAKVLSMTSGSDNTQREISAASTLHQIQDCIEMFREIKDEYTYAFLARSTPIFSTRLSVSLRPAVSRTMMGSPLMSRDNSRISRVVPGTGVTIAASR